MIGIMKFTVGVAPEACTEIDKAQLLYWHLKKMMLRILMTY